MQQEPLKPFFRRFLWVTIAEVSFKAACTLTRRNAAQAGCEECKLDATRMVELVDVVDVMGIIAYDIGPGGLARLLIFGSAKVVVVEVMA